MSMWFALLSGMGAVSMMTRGGARGSVAAGDEDGLRRLASSLVALRAITGAASAAGLLPGRHRSCSGSPTWWPAALVAGRGASAGPSATSGSRCCSASTTRPGGGWANSGPPLADPGARARRASSRRASRGACLGLLVAEALRARAAACGGRRSVPAAGSALGPQPAPPRADPPDRRPVRRGQPAARAHAAQRRDARAVRHGQLRGGRVLRRRLRGATSPWPTPWGSSSRLAGAPPGRRSSSRRPARLVGALARARC
ncbi:MAG: hypothetical protein MZV64_42565 [Ignavibacteriales bacterium]|nr:hypothetical protein [Ignavibacteriales bacterium]